MSSASVQVLRTLSSAGKDDSDDDGYDDDDDNDDNNLDDGNDNDNYPDLKIVSDKMCATMMVTMAMMY